MHFITTRRDCLTTGGEKGPAQLVARIISQRERKGVSGFRAFRGESLVGGDCSN